MSAHPSVFLRAYLTPLLPYLNRSDVTDIYINGPGEVWVETTKGSAECHTVPEIDDTFLWRLARQIASFSHQGISRAHPLLSAVLPEGSRVQIIAPPATRGFMAFAIRKHVLSDMAMNDYVADGAFAATRLAELSEPDRFADLQSLLKAGDFAGFMVRAVQERLNIMISGGTSTGKTTFLNALLKEIPDDQRLIFIEDTPELLIRQSNAVGLIVSRSELGEAHVTAEDLLKAALRMRPDRIILGELRGAEAYAFLRAVNTGHPGSITTIHADSPRGALEQLALIILQTGTQLSYDNILHYVRNVVDVFVQLDRHNGRRQISQIVFSHSHSW